MKKLWLGCALAMWLVLTCWEPLVHAFCGFYVSGADAELFNNATLVVMMREGKRTVLSMQNNYQGPPENFAMVVPVPVVLQEENVKTLPKEIFARVDQLAAPRLVEYWEQDPCNPPMMPERSMGARRPKARLAAGAVEEKDDLGVKVEAQFTVGEYQIVILSAADSSGLDTWLKREGYKIPEGAEPILRPYVQQGMKFFVAKVDVGKVTIQDGQAMLSPLRFHYDTDDFRLPVRLGLLNSHGTQDLIVHILAKGKRYEVANYENVTIPTNLDVAEPTRERFGEFYAALFDAVLDKNRGAVVTEYAWDSGSCDPCPVPALRPDELATLGADVIEDVAGAPAPPTGVPGRAKRWRRPMWSGFVLTRLHVRYGRTALGEDLVFRGAKAIAGGREQRAAGGKLETGAADSSVNNFQARYAVRHRWKGAVNCDNPVWGQWGGPPTGGPASAPRAATDLAFAERGAVKLASLVQQDVPEIGLKGTKLPAPGAAPQPPPKPSPPASSTTAPPPSSACGCRAPGRGRARAWWLVALPLLLGLRRRRRERRR